MAEGAAKDGPSSPEERVAGIEIPWIWHNPPLTTTSTVDLLLLSSRTMEAIRAAVAEEREKVVRLFARVQSLLISLQNESARRRVEDEKTETIMMRLLADIREFVPAGTRSEKDDAIRNRA